MATSNSPTFGMQFRSLTRIADDEERSAQEFAARALETRIRRLRLMKEHIQAGGRITDAQRKRLTFQENAYISAIEIKEDPGVKAVVDDMRRGIIGGITAVRDGLGKIIEALEKRPK